MNRQTNKFSIRAIFPVIRNSNKKMQLPPVKPAVLFHRVLQTKTVSQQALENQHVYM